jgi:hypothetical protein
MYYLYCSGVRGIHDFREKRKVVDDFTPISGELKSLLDRNLCF